ncbi:hypothetical protein B0H16DRAFT_1474567 [Mycena metata]|uniref:Uncharacterized protein n=1 Tax=Mycena metata TaxID=1033252 RepID=A0AAD7MJV5_9AGAR|nr:hypothetical protein B0H16DRAFT_1474567 [Mycena metata]
MNCAEVVFFPSPGAKSSCMPAHQQVVHAVELGAICRFIFECLHLLNSPAKEWARLDVIWHYQREFTIDQARIGSMHPSDFLSGSCRKSKMLYHFGRQGAQIFDSLTPRIKMKLYSQLDGKAELGSNDQKEVSVRDSATAYLLCPTPSTNSIECPTAVPDTLSPSLPPSLSPSSSSVVAGITITHHNTAITSTTPAAHHTVNSVPNITPIKKVSRAPLQPPERCPNVAINDGALKNKKVSY